MRINYKERAKWDLYEIHAYISEGSLKSAERILEKIIYSIELLETYPLLGHKGRVGGTRELIIAGTKYIVIYSLPDEYTVSIETILHGAMKYPE